jgi:hypothetical protein
MTGKALPMANSEADSRATGKRDESETAESAETPTVLVEVTDECGGKFMLDLEMTQAELDAWIARVPANMSPRDVITNGQEQARVYLDRSTNTWRAYLSMADCVRGYRHDIANNGPWRSTCPRPEGWSLSTTGRDGDD